MINVLIADNQNFVRKTLESYLESESDFKVVGFAENGATAIEQVEILKPDIVLMDIEMPVMDGFAATKTITERFSDTKVLMLSIHDKEQDVTRALKLGAKGYWLKNTTAKELADAIRHVQKGYFQLALELVDKHFNRVETANSQLSTDLELSKKLNKLDVVDAVLAQIEQKISSLQELTPQNLNETVESIVQQEMSFRKQKDANLQFKLDRLKHQLSQLEKVASLTIKAQLVCNFVLISAVIALSYFLFKNL